MDLRKQLEQDFLPNVSKPAQYLGNEYNIVRKNQSEVELRVALCYPVPYEQGMADSSFEVLYHVLNSRPSLWAERCFLPAPDARDVLENKNIPLFSLESKSPLSGFDVLAFDIRSERQYISLLSILKLGRIPLRAVERQGNFPLVIGGGLWNWNPEPLADFLDVAFIGKWQSGAVSILQGVLDARKVNQPKPDTLKQLSRLKGAYVPSLYQPVYNRFGNFEELKKTGDSAPGAVEADNLPEMNSISYAVNPLFPLIRVDDSAMDEIPDKSEIFLNYRHGNDRGTDRSLELVLGDAGTYLENPEMWLLLSDATAATFLWKKVRESLFLNNRSLRFSFPDCRLEDAEIPPRFPDYFREKEATIIAGAGAARLRALMNQYYRDDDLYRLLTRIIQAGGAEIRLIFMIGLPTEKPEDIRQLTELIGKSAQICRQGGACRLAVQIVPFVPKPYSAFQWEGFEGKQKLEAKYDLIRQSVLDSDVALHLEPVSKYILWSLLSRGSRALSHVLEHACLAGAGNRDDGDDFAIWEQAFRSKEINWEKLLESISVTLPLPWDHIDYGISKSDLKNWRLKALQGKLDSALGDYVHLGICLPRAQFEKLVRPGGPQDRQVETAQADPGAGGEEAAVQYGRKVRRQIKPAAPVKKKIRIQYAKTGLSRFISHLDVGRIFELAARRASIPLVYSQGKTPRPKMSFGPPLPLGVTSTAEFLDIEVNISDESDIQSAMNRHFPEGLKIIRYQPVFSKVAALSAVINLADYEIECGEHPLPEALIQNWMDRKEVWVEREHKDGIKSENIRPYVKEMKAENNRLKLRCRMIDGRTLRINELFITLQLPDIMNPATLVVCRTAQYIEKDGEVYNPLDVANG